VVAAVDISFDFQLSEERENNLKMEFAFFISRPPSHLIDHLGGGVHYEEVVEEAASCEAVPSAAAAATAE
jgi:hypothetical protein